MCSQPATNIEKDKDTVPEAAAAAVQVAVVEEEEQNNAEGNEQVEESAVNPEAPDDLDIQEDLNMLRSNCIGETLFSKCFVIGLLMKLAKREYELTEEFERELCSLWDMTLDKDVAIYLQENNALDIFREVIGLSDDKRLIEIVVGITGNMYTHEEVVNKDSFLLPYLHLVSCTDARTLIQVMRLLHSAYSVGKVDRIWLHDILLVPTFVQDLSHILSNSCNSDLLEVTILAINAMFEKLMLLPTGICQDEVPKNFENLFIRKKLVSSLFEAYDNFRPLIENPELMEDSTENHNLDKIITSFFSIHCLLMQFDQVSCDVYVDFMPQLVRITNERLTYLIDAEKLLPVTKYVESVVLGACDIHIYNMSFGFPCNQLGFGKILSIWQTLQIAQDNFEANSEVNKFEATDRDAAAIEKLVNLNTATKRFLTAVVNRLNKVQLGVLFAEQNETLLLNLCKCYEKRGEVGKTRAFKVKQALKGAKEQNKVNGTS